MAKHAGSSKGWGGARPGAGRPKGSVNKRTRETIKLMEDAKKNGIHLDPDETWEPLEVLLVAMNKFKQEGQWELAMQAAKDAAPYTNAKLSSVDIEAMVEKEDLSVTVLLNAANEDDEEEEKKRPTRKPA